MKSHCSDTADRIPRRSLLMLAGITTAIAITACSPRESAGEAPAAAAAPALEPARLSIQSVDPFHALVNGEPGAVQGAAVFHMHGKHQEPDPERGAFKEIEGDGSLRLVVDLQPGEAISLWAADAADAPPGTMAGPVHLTADPDSLPQIAAGGTESEEPVLVSEKITLQSLDDHHALLQGTAGAASGKSLLFAYGSHTNYAEGQGLERALGTDGSFQSVVDLGPGGEITLWAVGPAGGSAPLVLKTPALSR